MKLNKITVLLLTISLILIQYSCWDGDRSCKIQVTNLTGYRINALEFNDLHHEHTISLEPYDTSEVHTFIFEYRTGIFAPGPPEIRIYVTSYSDSINTYTNTTGYGHDIKGLSETKINKFKVELNPEYTNESGPFLVTLIE